MFSAIPTTNEDGIHVGGIVGFLRSLAFNINMIRPTRTIVVFDGKGGSNRRRKIFPQYKMGRKMSYRLNRANNFFDKRRRTKDDDTTTQSCCGVFRVFTNHTHEYGKQ